MLKEDVSTFSSENICALVDDLFDKAVAEGTRPNTVKTRSQPYNEIDRQTDRQAGRQQAGR